jgi:Lar family restriction alleviation protein
MNKVLRFKKVKPEPCPFCGSNNLSNEVLPYERKWIYYISCLNCESMGGFITVDIPNNQLKETSIIRWNSRMENKCVTR